MVKKQRALKYTDKQLEEVPTRARQLYHMLSNNDFQLIMDDEKYFLLQDQSAPTTQADKIGKKRVCTHYFSVIFRLKMLGKTLKAHILTRKNTLFFALNGKNAFMCY